MIFYAFYQKQDQKGYIGVAVDPTGVFLPQKLSAT